MPRTEPTATPSVPTATPGFPPVGNCGEGETSEVVWPTLETAEPAQAEPGEEVKVSGSGGYVKCGDAFNESARDFQLYWDGQPIDMINCYVNHCETTLNVPVNTAGGEHELSVEGGSTLEIVVQP